MNEANSLYHAVPREIADKRRSVAPEQAKAFREFTRATFAEGALSAKVKQLIAVAAAHVTQCPYCIQGHALAAVKEGATEKEIMEAIWVAAEMRAGAAYAHSAIALEAISDRATDPGDEPAPEK